MVGLKGATHGRVFLLHPDRAAGAAAASASVCDEGSASLVDSACAADLPPSTALRLMRTLEAEDFLTRAAGNSYQPGPRLIQIGAKAFSRETLVPLSRKPMEGVVGGHRGVGLSVRARVFADRAVCQHR